MNNRNTASVLVVYSVVVATLVGGIGIALAMVSGSAGSLEQSTRAKTPFEIQLQSAREVREALAKPVARPEPLAPITARLEKPVAKLAAVRPAPKRNPELAMRQAQQAFANIEPESQSFFSFLAFGPGRR